MEQKILKLIKKNKTKFKYYGAVKITGHDLNVIYGNVQVSGEDWFWFNLGFILYNTEEPYITFTMPDWEIKQQYKIFKAKQSKKNFKNESLQKSTDKLL